LNYKQLDDGKISVFISLIINKLHEYITNYCRKKIENMKCKRIVFYTLLLIVFLFKTNNQLFGQEKINIKVGVGMPELLNFGVSYQLNQIQIGAGVGFVPFVQDEKINSFFGDIHFHFGGFSKLSNRRSWYGRVGVNYFQDDTEYILYKYLYLNTQVGRDFNITKRMGIAAGAGFMYRLNYEEVENKPSSGWNISINYSALPSFEVRLFYRIGGQL